MKINSAITTLAAVSVTFALSTSAFAGELYGGLDKISPQTSPLVLSANQAPLNSFGQGAVYAEANDALDNFKGSAAEQPAYVTTLAVGGELGAPIRDGNYHSLISDSAFAE